MAQKSVYMGPGTKGADKAGPQSVYMGTAVGGIASPGCTAPNVSPASIFTGVNIPTSVYFGGVGGPSNAQSAYFPLGGTPILSPDQSTPSSVQPTTSTRTALPLEQQQQPPSTRTAIPMDTSAAVPSTRTAKPTETGGTPPSTRTAKPIETSETPSSTRTAMPMGGTPSSTRTAMPMETGVTGPSTSTRAVMVVDEGPKSSGASEGGNVTSVYMGTPASGVKSVYMGQEEMTWVSQLQGGSMAPAFPNQGPNPTTSVYLTTPFSNTTSVYLNN